MKETAQNTKELTYENVKKILQKENNGFNKPYILRQLHQKENLRRVFLSVIKKEPARISEIFEESLLTKPTCYAQLYKLLELQVVSRVFVSDVLRNPTEDPDIKQKFDAWTNNMPDKLKRYYLAKTSYWKVGSIGKEIAGKAYLFDQQFRIKQSKEGLC